MNFTTFSSYFRFLKSTVLLIQFWLCSSSRREACSQFWTQTSWYDTKTEAFQQISQKSERTVSEVLLVLRSRQTKAQNTGYSVQEWVIDGCQIRSQNGVYQRMRRSHWKTSSPWLSHDVYLSAVWNEVKQTALEGRFLEVCPVSLAVQAISSNSSATEVWEAFVSVLSVT